MEENMSQNTSSYEVNFDGLVGPTHNYAGLSSGNVASTGNKGQISSPKAAAKQGLKKAMSLANLGLKQGLLAPHCRPDFSTLRSLGFSGSDKQVIEKAGKKAPEVLAACYSASAMWTANAATVSPSADSADGKVHFTPANLNNKFHRMIEPTVTGRILQATFPDTNVFSHHKPLPQSPSFGDEGAANHTRFCQDFDQAGVQLFVFGRYGFRADKPEPKVYPARQTYEASQAIARLHQLSDDRVVYAQQNPEVIDQGVFHNDVISVGHQNVYFYHQQALLNSDQVLKQIESQFDGDFHFVQVATDEVSVKDAVQSYLFNSQLITLGQNKMAIVVPEECRKNKAVWDYLQKLPSLNSPIQEVLVYDVTESMKNGGGPACLRLRVALTSKQLASVNQNTLLTPELFSQINQWIDQHYRDQISPDDLLDPNLADECRTALDKLTQILNLGSVYDFQR